MFFLNKYKYGQFLHHSLLSPSSLYQLAFSKAWITMRSHLGNQSGMRCIYSPHCSFLFLFYFIFTPKINESLCLTLWGKYICARNQLHSYARSLFQERILSAGSIICGASCIPSRFPRLRSLSFHSTENSNS